MDRRAVQRSMYEVQHAGRAPRFMLAALGAVWAALAWWLLVGGGLENVGRWFGRNWPPGDPIRRTCLGAGLLIYYIRILFTEFVFLKRGMGWSEAFTIAPWMLFIFLLAAIAGGTNRAAMSAAGWVGVVLYLAGSWVNSYSEYARHVWKQRPENHGRLYTEGLFRYSRHPNYFGDLVLFPGLSLICGAWITAVVPLLMLGFFVFVNIPMLDSHLHDHYGASFGNYARRTRKLIPFVY